MCVCVSVLLGSSRSFKHVSLNSKSYPFKFPDKCFGFRLELVDEFTKIVPSAFFFHPPIPTWNQDTYQETRKDTN